jgi:hypothetical protein
VPAKPESPAVYIRTKTLKGRTYYQVVEGYRVGWPVKSKVRQRIVVSLGTDPTIAGAIRTTSRALAQRRRDRARLPREVSQWTPRDWVRRIDAIDQAIHRLTCRLELLRSLAQSVSTGTTTRRRPAPVVPAD